MNTDLISRQAAIRIVWECYKKAMSIDTTDTKRLLLMVDDIQTTLAYMRGEQDG